MKKVAAALLLLMAFVLPVTAQDTDEEWVTYTDYLDVVRFDYPASWEIIEPHSYDYQRLRYLSHTQIAGANNQSIYVEVERIESTRWGFDFNLSFDTDFETLIAEAIRWRDPDYKILEFGGRQFISFSYATQFQSRALNYLTTYLDTGILGTIITLEPDDGVTNVSEIAERVASSLEYTGDFPVDLSCVPLDLSYSFPVTDGEVSIGVSSEWQISPLDPQYYRETTDGIYIVKNEELAALELNLDRLFPQNCFGPPNFSFELQIEQDPELSSVADFERRAIEQSDIEVSIEHLVLQGRPGILVSSSGLRFVGNLENGNLFKLYFNSHVPRQTERWRDLGLAMVESITFEPSE